MPMRARFTDSIASVEGWGYDAGQEVAIDGTDFLAGVVPVANGDQWLATGLLEPVAAPADVADAQHKETAVTPRSSVPASRSGAPAARRGPRR